MSKIQAVPYISKVVNSLTDAQKEALLSLINGSQDTPTFRSLINKNNLITAADQGVSYIALETQDRMLTGYLMYNDAYCVMVAYQKDNQNLMTIDIDLTDLVYRTVDEPLSVLGFRVTVEMEIAGEGFDPSDIEVGDIEQDGVLGLNSDNELVKGSLYGKFVRVIDAPESDTLTSEQIELFTEGVFVNGTFLEVKNPIFCPAVVDTSSKKFGLVITGSKISVYSIEADGKVTINTDFLSFGVIDKNFADFNIRSSRDLNINCNRSLNLSALSSVTIQSLKLSTPPNDNKSYMLKSVNRTGEWIEGNVLYKHTIVFNTDYEIQLISSNATAVDSLSSLAALLQDPKTTQILYVDHTNDECVFAPYGHSGNDASYDDQANKISVDLHYPNYDAIASTKCSFVYIGLIISAPDGVTITDTVTAL